MDLKGVSLKKLIATSFYPMDKAKTSVLLMVKRRCNPHDFGAYLPLDGFKSTAH